MKSNDAHQDLVDRAYQEYLNRQSRASKPEGTWTRSRRPDGSVESIAFHPSDSERQPCCSAVENETSMSLHCRSAKHIAHIFGLDPNEFSSYVRGEQVRKTRRRRRTGQFTPSYKHALGIKVSDA